MNQMPDAEEIDWLLRKLPVRPEHAAKISELRKKVRGLAQDRDLWRIDRETYARAWLRELGGRVFHKRHHIDALVLTTRHVYSWYLYGVRAHGFSENRHVSTPSAAREMVIGDIGEITFLDPAKAPCQLCNHFPFGQPPHRPGCPHSSEAVA